MGFSVASNKKYKPRKPRPVSSWWVFDAEKAVVHGNSGRIFFGVKRIRAIGNFLIKAADYLESVDD
jgi:hypothetical protein